MYTHCRFLLGPCSAAAERYLNLLVLDGKAKYVAVLLALSGCETRPPNPFRLTSTGRQLLIEWLSGGVVHRLDMSERVNRLLPGVAEVLGAKPARPVTPGHLGVIVHRIRKEYQAELRRELLRRARRGESAF